MQIGDKSICQKCVYCWVSENICSAYGSLKGYGCTMFEDKYTHMKYPAYMRNQSQNMTYKQPKQQSKTSVKNNPRVKKTNTYSKKRAYG